MLDIELTESCLIEDEHSAIELIKQFRKLGARVHLDDFGTGYSSLSQLARIPLDAIKLDASFVRGVNENPVSQALARAIVAVARTLELKVIAEGVETSEETAFLDTLGVDAKQGYLYAAHAGGRVHRMAGAAASAAPDRLSACAGSPGACTRPPPRGRSMHGGFHAGLRPGGAAPVLRNDQPLHVGAVLRVDGEGGLDPILGDVHQFRARQPQHAGARATWRACR